MASVLPGILLPSKGPLRQLTVPSDIWEHPDRAATALGLSESKQQLPADDVPYRMTHTVDVAHLYGTKIACSLYIASKPDPAAELNERATLLCRRLHAAGDYKLRGDVLLVGVTIAEIEKELRAATPITPGPRVQVPVPVAAVSRPRYRTSEISAPRRREQSDDEQDDERDGEHDEQEQPFVAEDERRCLIS